VTKHSQPWVNINAWRADKLRLSKQPDTTWSIVAGYIEAMQIVDKVAVVVGGSKGVGLAVS